MIIRNFLILSLALFVYCSAGDDFVLKKLLFRNEENSHWCCKIDLTEPDFETRTRIVEYTYVASGKHRCGYHSCGFLGLGSCTSWCYNYWVEKKTHLDEYVITVQKQCPHEYITCCNGYMLVAGHCLSVDDVKENQQLLDLLNQQSIIQIGK